MTATVETGGEKRFEDLLSQPDADDAGAHAQHIGVVVGPRQASGEEVVAQRGTHSANLVGGELFALPAAADDDAHISLIVADGTSNGRAELGIVARLRAVSSEVENLMLRLEQSDQMLLQLVPGVIGADGDSRHQPSLRTTLPHTNFVAANALHTTGATTFRLAWRRWLSIRVHR